MLPRHVYHVAEAANWPLIQRHGLLSAERLMTLAGLSAQRRRIINAAQRPLNVQLPGGFEIRHQRPMPPSGLAACLVGMQPAAWYALLNQRVFFWLDPERLKRMCAALGPGPQAVLTIDTAALLEVHAAAAHVTPINTGNARRRPARRGLATFVPYCEWLANGWASEAAALGCTPRSRRHAPVELTILHAVPDVMRYVVDVTPLAGGERLAAKRGSR